MELFTIILIIFIFVYWGYCIFGNTKATPYPQTASEYFIAGRSISPTWFILAATATSFSGWTFMSHPGMIYSYGFQASFISFYAITIPLTGVLFLKRQWILGKRDNFITPGDMFATYFKSAQNIKENKSPQPDGIKILVVIVAFLFSFLYIAVQLRASGYLMNTLINKDAIFLPKEIFEKISMWLLAIFLLLYVLPRGLKRVAYVDQLQFFLLVGGMVVIGVIAFFWQLGGWDRLTESIIHLANYDYHRAPHTAEYSHYIAIPGIIQWDVWNSNIDTSADGWTGMMLLTFMLALMGIQASPAFTMWAFSNQTPKAFAPQQLWASALLIGLIMLIFTTIQGFGAHFLGADTEFARTNPDMVKYFVEPLVNDETNKIETDRLVPNLILSFTKITDNFYGELIISVIIGFLAIAALAAIQSTASSYISTFGGIVTRDLIGKRDLDKEQISSGKWSSGFVVVIALILASLFGGQEIALLGGLAVAYGLQMWPALVAVCWWPFLTRQGIKWGLIAGLIVVTLTENPGDILTQFFGFQWMRWPLTIHSAGWGVLANFIVAFLVSCGTQNKEEIEHRMEYHRFLQNYASLPASKKRWKPFAWLFTLTWFAFAIGPGAVVGNDFFGNPNDPNSWLFFGIVPIWAWQAVWWGIGVAMIAFLAYYMELSTMSDEKIDEINKLSKNS